LLPIAAPAKSYAERPAAQRFIKKMVHEYAFNKATLERAFAQTHKQQAVIDAITRPAEAKPWYQYRPIFITPKRIAGGARFWRAHRKTLARAANRYGVAPAILVAIIGVESGYGQSTGHYSALTALATLAFDYPPRQAFFRAELVQYLLLARAEGIDPTKPRSSYAGALGCPQFMPSSYRHYAVDFDGDGERNLWTDWADVIGSIAHYLDANGWRRGGRIALPAALPAGDPAPKGALQPGKTTVNALRQAGLKLPTGLAADRSVELIALEQPNSTDYWLGFHNFGVIQTYNRSPLYAMAVTELAHRIRHTHAPARKR
jgi:membrane-bound lytic murein transglycosylase B